MDQCEHICKSPRLMLWGSRMMAVFEDSLILFLLALSWIFWPISGTNHFGFNSSALSANLVLVTQIGLSFNSCRSLFRLTSVASETWCSSSFRKLYCTDCRPPHWLTSPRRTSAIWTVPFQCFSRLASIFIATSKNNDESLWLIIRCLAL